MRAVAGRVLAAGVTVLGASAILFWAVTVLPGDPATRVLGSAATPERAAALRSELGLDRPAAQRYLEWLGGAVRGDLGTSLVSRVPVRDVLGPRLLNTVALVAVAALLAVVLALVAGVVAGLHGGSTRDRVLSATGVAGLSVPDFVLAGLLVTLFGFGLGWLPPTSLLTAGGRPWQSPEAMVLPVVSLALPTAAWLFRYVRSGVVSAAGSPHVETARLTGIPPATVLTRHLLPAALLPSLQAIGYAGAALLGGTVVVERVFSYPGIGLTMVDAVAGRDAPVVLAVGVLLSAAVVVALTLADVASALLDPRVRLRAHR